MNKCALLVVDDNPDNLTVMEGLLAQALPDVEPVLARDAEEALALVTRRAVQAGLIDVQMPGVDGIELCRRLKAADHTRHIPLILITAHNSTSALRARGLDAGADDFISRPIDNVELAARIRVLLRIKRAEDELRDVNLRLERLVNERTRELRDTEQRYRLLFTTLQDAFALHEILCDDNGALVECRFLEVNPAFERLTGLPADKIRGRSLSGVMPDLPQSCIAKLAHIAIAGQAAHFEQYLPSLDKHFEVAAFSPRPMQFACVYNDITALKQAADTLEKLNAQLEDKNNELNSIIYATSHDLRSPLVNIQGFSLELQRTCGKLRDFLATGAVPPESRDRLETLINSDVAECVHYIASSVGKMDRLLIGLLQLSRLGRTDLEIEPLDMNETLRDILQTMEFQMQAAGVRVQVGELPDCFGDATQVNRIFSNLLDNALKYLEPSRPGQIRVEGHIEDDHAVYRVIDNGIGIPATQCQRVFEIFQRLGLKSNVPGEGLGLTSVRRLVERHNGRIWLESKVDEGSTFYVALPLAPV